MNHIYKIILFASLLLFSNLLKAQVPVNDDCSNAEQIWLNPDNYGSGIFTSTQIDLTNATKVMGEPIHTVHATAGTDKKTVWFKFHLPTARGIRVTLRQPAQNIAEDGAGFTVFKSNTCMPTVADVIPAKITPINKFGNSYNPCLDPGDYFIQVSSKSDANNLVYIELEVTQPDVLNFYDKFIPSDVNNLGVVSYGWKSVDYDVGCLTIDDASELCSNVLGADYLEFTQSSWHVFTTDNFVDVIRLQFLLLNGTNSRIGLKVYRGDVRTTAISALTVEQNCTLYNQSGDINFTCKFIPNTVYSVQFFFHKDEVNTFRFQLYELGEAATKAPSPASLTSAPGNANDMGLLAANSAGIWTSNSDWLSCNSKIINNVCGTVNPASGNVSGRELATWYKFELAESSNVIINTSNYTLKNVYAGDVTTNCNLALYQSFTTTSQTNLCMPAGVYSIQLSGYLNTTGANILNESSSKLGRAANISINVQSVGQVNNYNLSVAGRVDTINSVDGVQEALPNNVTIYSKIDKFGCIATVLPNSTCGGDRAIYRTIKIDAYGTLEIGGGNWRFAYGLYRGDAEALSIAQNAHNPGDIITGMERMGCVSYWNSVTCVSPGIYTLVSFGDANDIAYSDQPWFRFRNEVLTSFTNPTNPENLGDITAAHINASGTNTYWSCYDNPLTIVGKAPCYSATKQIYRQFYVSSARYLTFSSNNTFRVFYGKISDGIGTLSASIPGYGEIACVSSFSADINPCAPRKLPAGWYTIVSYAGGGIYAGSNYSANLGSNNITISEITPKILPKPKFYKPSLASNAGVLDWGPNTGTVAYPVTDRMYNLETDYFDCNDNLPFTSSLVPCSGTTYNRVSYYVFEIARESFVSIFNISSAHMSVIHRLDVRTSDSLLLASDTPIQPCIQETGYGNDNALWEGRMDICKMQPGVYTLIVFSNNANIDQSLSPRIYVEKVEDSRFDHNSTAYDFGDVPGDSIWYNGKSIAPGVSEANPLDAGRAASNDFFSCKTGAQITDPHAKLCWDGEFPINGVSSVPYPMTNDYNFFSSLTGNTTNKSIRRNLWYTFTVTGPGRVYVEVQNKTISKGSGGYGQSPWVLLRSTTDALLDSTFNQSLSQMWSSSYYTWWGTCDGNYSSTNFYIEPCDAPTTRRYYVLVDQNAPHVWPNPNNQVEVRVKFEPETPIIVKYDFYSEANIINGLNETDAPYTQTNLTAGEYTGAESRFPCSTRTSNDQNTCGQTTLWYAFDVAFTGKLRINYELINNSNVSSRVYNANDMVLLREIVPGDSTSTGLLKLNPTAKTIGGLPWGETCLNEGRYYIMLTGCSYDSEKIIPHVQIVEEAGDFCSNPALLPDLTAIGSSTGSVSVDCHTIGEGFGEDGSNMSCLFGPAGYKSTWFKVNINIATKVDLTFKLSENTSAFPHQIRYRIMYGQCGYMTAGPCNTDALTEFTLNCMKTDGVDYFVQVVTPENAVGDITLTVTTTESIDQLCVPFDPNKPIANFLVDDFCLGTPVPFVNYSTQGAAISYEWDFGDSPTNPTPPNSTSTDFEPTFSFPNDIVEHTYNVTLKVTNNDLGTSNSVQIPFTLYPLTTGSITRTAPYDSPNIVGVGVDINYHSNPIGHLAGPPTTTYDWYLGPTLTSTVQEPTVQYTDSDIGEIVTRLEITNQYCVFTTTDTIVVGFEAIWQGGPFDGASKLSVNDANCPVFDDLVFEGGPYDGASKLSVNDGNCPAFDDPVFDGGPYDGASKLSVNDGNCPAFDDPVFDGGPYDGASKLSVNDGNCPDYEELVYDGGPYDGASAESSGKAKIPSGTNGTVYICIGDNTTLSVDGGEPFEWYEYNTGTTSWDLVGTDPFLNVQPITTTKYKVTTPSCGNPITYNHTAIMPGLADASITASTTKAGYFPYGARLNNAVDNGWWANTNDANQWLKVDLGATKVISSFATQGRVGAANWVSSYQISFSDDDVNWSYYEGNNLSDAKVFLGNANQNSVVTYEFPRAISARYFRIHPVTWNTNIAMRLEVYEGTVLSETIQNVDSIIVQVDDILANVDLGIADTCFTTGIPKQFTAITGIVDETPYTLEFLWDFGDGNTSTDRDPLYSFTSEGDKNVSLTISIPGSCSKTVTKTVNSVGRNLNKKETICIGNDITLIPTRADTQPYEWFIEPNVISFSTNSTVTVSPVTNTTYRVEGTDACNTPYVETFDVEVIDLSAVDFQTSPACLLVNIPVLFDETSGLTQFILGDTTQTATGWNDNYSILNLETSGNNLVLSAGQTEGVRISNPIDLSVVRGLVSSSKIDWESTSGWEWETKTFTEVGLHNWQVPYGVTEVEVLVVGGGGGGGMDMGGGGGGGAVIYNATYSTGIEQGSVIPIYVGAGGKGGPAAGTYGQPTAHQYTKSATNGESSYFGTMTALGGGYGGSSYFAYTPNNGYGGSGASGGGASGYSDTNTGRGGLGTAGLGFNGGNSSGQYYSGGGGGAGGPGSSGPAVANGGPGVLNSILGVPYYWGGGGGGAAYTLSTGGNGGIGGGGGGAVGVTIGGAGLNDGLPGGGGSPVSQTNKPGGDGGANTGGGGGGGSHYNSNNKGGDGGSGIVILKYKLPKVKVYTAVTTDGITPPAYKGMEVFTSNGTFTVPDGVSKVEVFVVAGGGGGGSDMGGGGGGGGVVYKGNYSTGIIPGAIIPIVVGNGGDGSPAGGTNGQPSNAVKTVAAKKGGNSSFGSLIAIGGGYGGTGSDATLRLGTTGGSGGGAGAYGNSVGAGGGLGTAGQGFNGGNGFGSYYGGGGGGAGYKGIDGPDIPHGGRGILNSILGIDYYWGGGGGTSAYSVSPGGNGGIGGGGGGAVGVTTGGIGYNNGSAGGGGVPVAQTNFPGGDAGANTGGGGGGGSHYSSNNKGGNGGSGIVVVKWERDAVKAGQISDINEGDNLAGKYLWVYEELNSNGGASPELSKLKIQIVEQDLNFNWDFGDGSTATIRDTSHTYTTNGNKTVTLTVDNRGLCPASIQKTINVSPNAYALDYRTKSNGNWTDLSIWQVKDPATNTWVNATAFSSCLTVPYPTSASKTILVQNNVTYDTDIAVGIDETTISAAGTLTVPAGIDLKMVDVSSSTIAADIDNKGRINIAGSFTVVGTSLLVNSATSTVAYTNGDQTMWDGIYGKLEVSGTGLKKVNGNNTNVITDVKFIDGYIKLNNRNFYLGENCTVTGAGYGIGYFITNLSGSLVKDNVGVAGKETFEFPVGYSTTEYNKAVVTNGGTPDDIFMRVNNTFSFDNTVNNDELIFASSVNRTWFMNESVSGGSDITLAVYWVTANENVDFDNTDSHIGYFDPTTGWERIGGNAAATGSGTYADMFTRYTTGISKLNAFSVGSCMYPILRYRTVADGDWTDTDIWEVQDASLNWVPTSTFTSACGLVPYPSSTSLDIDVRHNVNFDYSIPQGVDELTIESGAVLTIPTGNTFILVNGTGTDMLNFGKVVVTGNITRNGSGSTVDNQPASIFLYNGGTQTILDADYAVLQVQGNLPDAAVTKNLESSNTYVSEQLEFINSKINLNFDMTIGEDASIINPSQTNGYFVATGNGFLIRKYKAGLLSAKNFPVGGVYYSPANLTFDNATIAGTMKTKVKEVYHPNLSTNAINRYWTLEQGTLGFTGSYSLDLTYSVNDLPSIPTSSAQELTMVKIAGAYNPAYLTPEDWYFSEALVSGDKTIGYVPLSAAHTGTLTHDEFAGSTDFTLTSNAVVCNPFYNLAVTDQVCINSNYTFPDGTVMYNISSQKIHTSYLFTSVQGCDSIITTTVDVYDPSTSNYALYGEREISPDNVNYPNFQSAIDSLMRYGIKSNITFRTVNTTYVEQLKIGKICGASGVSQVLFTSICDDCERPLIEFNSDVTPDNYTLQFDFTENVTFKRIDFEALGNTKARIVDIISCNKIVFDDCIFKGYQSTTATDDQRSLIHYSGNTTIGGMTFKNSNFKYGSYAIQIENPAVDMVNIYIDDNKFTNQSAGYLKLSKNKAPKIRRNVMNSSSTINNFVGISLSLITDKLVMEANEVYSFANGKALEINDVDLHFLDAIISNNMLGIGSGSNKTCYGIDIFNGSSNVNIYNNSVNVNSSNGAALNIDGLDNGDLINNIFCSTLGAASAVVANYTNSQEVYNDFYPDYAGKDGTSVSINPAFNTPDDLHTEEITLQMSTATCVATDIDNEPRQNPFYLGADEFLGEVNWTGNVNTDWNNTGNWNPAVIPTRGTTVNIGVRPKLPELNSSSSNLAEVRKLAIQAGAHLYIAPKKYLTVYGPFVNHGEFIIKSDPTGTGSFIPKMNPGTITGSGVSKVEQYISANKWHYVSSPVIAASGVYSGTYYWWNEKVKDRWWENDFVNWNWNGTSTPVPVNQVMGWTPASGTMQIGEGYAYLGTADKTVVAQGELNSGNYTVNLDFTDQGGDDVQDIYDGWNLLGNPYPSTINWNSQGIEMTNVDNAIYVYNDAGDAKFDNYDYYMRGATNSPYPLIALNASADSCHIAPNQSVMVRTNATGAKVVITNEARRHRQTTFYKSKQEHPDLLKLAVVSGKYSDETALRFIPKTTAGYDGEYDAVKRYPASTKVPQISFRTPVCDLAINTLPEITDGLIVPISLRIYQAEKYTFTRKTYNFAENVTAFLIDKDNKKRINLDKTSEYSVKLDAGRYDDRFYIYFKKDEQIAQEEPQQEILDINEIADENVEIFAYKKNVNIELSSVKSDDTYVVIFDVLGKKIISKQIISDKTLIPMGAFAAGNYIVKVITKHKVYEQKVFIE